MKLIDTCLLNALWDINQRRIKYMTPNNFKPAGVSRRTGHPQVKVPGIRATIDANIAPYVKTLNDNGLRTKYSCGYTPYICRRTPHLEVMLAIRDILEKQGFVKRYDSYAEGLVFKKYDGSKHVIADADADYYPGLNEERKENGIKTTDEYEWAIQSYRGYKKGLKNIIEPFVDALKHSPVIRKFKNGI
jgi:hypothetical protein